MVNTSRIGTRHSERLITELPLKESMAMYVDAWKQLLWTTVKSVTVFGAGLAIVAIASTFLTVATVAGVASSVLAAFASFIMGHPYLSGFALLVFVVGLIGLRASRVHAK